MANWEKLDKEFYDVVNNLTAQQWQSWREQQNHNRMIRQHQKEMEMKMQLLKLSFASFNGKPFLIRQNVDFIELSKIENENIEVINNDNKIATSFKYALAA